MANMDNVGRNCKGCFGTNLEGRLGKRCGGNLGLH